MLVLLFLAYVLSFIDRQILSLLVGPIRADFGISDFEYSLLQGAAFAVLYTVSGLPLGRLADRHSRTTIIAGAVAAWSLLTCACGMAKSYGQLFVARMGVGAGEAGLAPPAYSLIIDSFPPARVGYAMALYKTGVTVGGGLALVSGGFLLDFFSARGGLTLPLLGHLVPWQATFMAVGAPGFVLSMLILLLIREPPRRELGGASAARDAEPIGAVLRFLWQRKRLYGSLFIGSSLLAMVGYGSAAWYPEFLYRNHGMSKSEAGSLYGTVFIVAGTLGVIAGPWLANRLRARGHADALVRVIFYAALAVTVPAVAAPLLPDPTWVLVLLVPVTLMGAVYLGLMAAAFPLITPNRMRGLTTAIYLFVTNIIGMAVGTSALAAFTDFVFRADGALHLSIASISALFYPLAALCFAICLPAYRKAMEEAAAPA